MATGKRKEYKEMSYMSGNAFPGGMLMRKVIAGIGVIAAIVLIAVLARRWPAGIAGQAAGSDPLAELADCLAERGVVLYGAFWCPHCQEQKRLFGRAAARLPYVECATSDGRGQAAACRDAGIRAYPAWAFPDGTQATGVLAPAALAARAGCPAPALPERF